MSAADEIKKLKDLLDAGVITQEEFDGQKNKLLGITKIRPISSQNLPPRLGEKKKRSRLTTALIVLFICSMIYGVSRKTLESKPLSIKPSKTPSATSSPQEAKERLIAFDEQSWGDFKNLYKAHNNLMRSIEAYSDGKISDLTFYDTCMAAEEYFRKVSITFTYGTDESERKYLEVFQSAAISDQMAAESLIKYLDSKKTSDLSSANENIQLAKTAFLTIAGNRGLLLAKTGLTKEVLDKKITSDMAELDAEFSN